MVGHRERPVQPLAPPSLRCIQPVSNRRISEPGPSPPIISHPFAPICSALASCWSGRAPVADRLRRALLRARRLASPDLAHERWRFSRRGAMPRSPLPLTRVRPRLLDHNSPVCRDVDLDVELQGSEFGVDSLLEVILHVEEQRREFGERAI